MTVSKHLASLDLGPARHLLMNNDPYVRRAHAGTSPPAAVPCMSTLTPVGGFVGNLDPRPYPHGNPALNGCVVGLRLCAPRASAAMRIYASQATNRGMHTWRGGGRWRGRGSTPHAHMVPLLHETDLIIRRARGVTDRS